MNTMTFTCVHCDKEVTARSHWFCDGQELECPHCKGINEVGDCGDGPFIVRRYTKGKK